MQQLRNSKREIFFFSLSILTQREYFLPGQFSITTINAVYYKTDYNFQHQKNTQQSEILLYRRLDSSHATIAQITTTGSHRTEAS